MRVVKIVQVVERPDAVAVVQEPFANVRADEAGAAGDEEIHARKLNGQMKVSSSQPVQHVNHLPQAAVIAAVEIERDAREFQMVVVFYFFRRRLDGLEFFLRR